MGYDGHKEIKGNKLSALVDRNGLPLSCTVAASNVHDSRIYKPTLEAFEIPEVQDRPTVISADAAYDAHKYVIITGNKESRATLQSTGDPRNI